ncbi:MAG: ATP-dependent phosphofructokinase / diphosphate-dependent phosphofructokinase [Chloroflexota bacterium]|nr:ATP-dependent phosphofructokinase / diphosphate-dependent phosphofructokinase [Chloroflexota bacterium]
MTINVGVLTAGGDTPGLNAALRGLGKSAEYRYDLQLVGFYDGFRGLLQDRCILLDESALSGILTLGGTILGTSRDKPRKMLIGGRYQDMRDAMVETYHKHHLDVLVCMGGGGTQKNAYSLAEKGLNVLTLPKTIDNDIANTDVTLGFDTALGIATDAIDRLHSTAHSHHRIIIVEVMGHNAGWLALGAGVAGGADVILIPEIPYDPDNIAEAIMERSRSGKHFSIVAVSEGAMSVHDRKREEELKEEIGKAENKKEKAKAKEELDAFYTAQSGKTMRLAQDLEVLTGLEARVTILGYVQRGGTPSARDRLLGSQLGGAAADLIADGAHGVMVAVKGQDMKPVSLKSVVNKLRLVPTDHIWVETARRVGTCLGD